MKTLLSSLILAVLLALSFGIWWSVSDTTVYATGFSEEAFQQLRPGMEIGEVYALLGQPLATREEDSPERWCYGEAPMLREGSTYVVANAFSSPPCVLFNEAGLVIASTGGGLEAIQRGMTAGEVLELVGEPVRSAPAAALTLHYSQPGGEGLFRGRIVAFDADRRVSDVISYQFSD